MRSRERVQMALAHQEPDRVPIDLGATAVTSIAIPTYAALRKHLGLAQREIRTLETVQQIAWVDDDALDRLGVDAIPVYANPPGGGFVFNPVHNIQPLVPPANVAALFDAAQEFGRYPSKMWCRRTVAYNQEDCAALLSPDLCKRFMLPIERGMCGAWRICRICWRH